MNEVSAAKPSILPKAMLAVGVVLFLVFAGIGGWKLYSRMQHATRWQPVAADVTFAGEMCQMAYKTGKSWRNSGVVACADVDTFKAKDSGRTWRATPATFVTLAYEAGGARQEVLTSDYNVPPGAAVAGGKAAILVDPADPNTIDRAVDARDYKDFAIVAGMGLVAMIAAVLLGVFIGRMNARSVKKRAAA